MRNLQGVVMPDEGKLDVDCVQGSTHAVTEVMAAVATSALAMPAVATPAAFVAPADTEKGAVGAMIFLRRDEL